MARQNSVYQYLRVAKPPHVGRNLETGEVTYCMCYGDIIRSVRDAHDNVKYVKHSYPLIMSKNPEIAEKMSKWEENDIVYLKGVISSAMIPKKSYCPNCKDADGMPTANITKGLLVFVNPIYVNTVKHCADKKEGCKELLDNKEVSNQVLIMGTVCSDPKEFVTKKGLAVTQYQLAINRKFHIKSDDPSVRTDWPWVKSYGEQAVEDRMRLMKGSDVLIDGFLQARTIHRKKKCEHCGQIYEWEDRAMELVPYDVEYVKGTYKTDEMLEAENNQKVEDIRQQIYDNLMHDHLEEEEDTEDFEKVSS